MIADNIEYTVGGQVAAMTFGNSMALTVDHDNKLRETARTYTAGVEVLYSHVISGNGGDIPK